MRSATASEVSDKRAPSTTGLAPERRSEDLPAGYTGNSFKRTPSGPTSSLDLGDEDESDLTELSVSGDEADSPSVRNDDPLYPHTSTNSSHTSRTASPEIEEAPSVRSIKSFGSILVQNLVSGAPPVRASQNSQGNEDSDNELPDTIFGTFTRQTSTTTVEASRTRKRPRSPRIITPVDPGPDPNLSIPGEKCLAMSRKVYWPGEIKAYKPPRKGKTEGTYVVHFFDNTDEEMSRDKIKVYLYDADFVSCPVSLMFSSYYTLVLFD
jgi:hypothetical protein